MMGLSMVSGMSVANDAFIYKIYYVNLFIVILLYCHGIVKYYS